MADRCRSCDAPIEWAITPKGQRMPLDVASHPDANLIIDDGGIVRVVGKGHGIRISHFVTCPQRDQHRKRGRPP